MSDTLWCQLCRQAVEGLTLYHVSSGRLFVCEGCYAQLVAKEHQPHSRWMRQLRLVLKNLGKEVVPHEGNGNRVVGSMVLGDSCFATFEKEIV